MISIYFLGFPQQNRNTIISLDNTSLYEVVTGFLGIGIGCFSLCFFFFCVFVLFYCLCMWTKRRSIKKNVLQKRKKKFELCCRYMMCLQWAVLWSEATVFTDSVGCFNLLKWSKLFAAFYQTLWLVFMSIRNK